MLDQLFLALSATVLGLFSGCLLTEAALLVPYWRSMSAEDFLDLHHTLGPRLYRFFAPLTIAATVVPAVVAGATWFQDSDGKIPAAVASFIMLGILGLYFAYFSGANARFAAGTLNSKQLASELRRWSALHWLRTIAAILAFVFSLWANMLAASQISGDGGGFERPSSSSVDLPGNYYSEEVSDPSLTHGNDKRNFGYGEHSINVECFVLLGNPRFLEA